VLLTARAVVGFTVANSIIRPNNCVLIKYQFLGRLSHDITSRIIRVLLIKHLFRRESECLFIVNNLFAFRIQKIAALG